MSPITEPAFAGRIGETIEDSQPWWPDPESGRSSGPNVVMVVLDDTGWSDFGCFGSEVATPNIDRLADNGLRYTNFHVTPLCSPTRASLLTGCNHHRVGMRFLSAADTGFPNSRGRLPADVATLPALLRRRGYGTYLAGKWHLAPAEHCGPAGPFHHWPLARGFDRFYGFLSGASDQHAPELVRDNSVIEPPRRNGYHLSEDLADQAIGFLRDHVALRPRDPFYLQLAFGATHAPFQAPREFIDHYIEVFGKGWDRIRRDRLRRQLELGVAPPETQLAERDSDVPHWAELTVEERELATRLQAAFAGFLEHTDAQIGRLMGWLDRAGVLDNTAVFVLSDNGAANDGGRTGAASVIAPYNGISRSAADQIGELERIGGRDGPAHYPSGWATAGNTPFRLYKEFVDLGGVRSPLVVHWPGGISGRGEFRNQFAHAIDIAPTVLELAGHVQHANQSHAMDGASISATFPDAAAPAPRDTQYFEMLGHRAIWHRGWKAVTRHVAGQPYPQDTWRLYDTSEDFAECVDVSEQRPDLLATLQELWWREAKTHDVLPLDDRPLKTLLALPPPTDSGTRKRLRLFPGQSHLSFAIRTAGLDRSMSVRARLHQRSADDEGVLLASGLSYGGYTLYVLDSRLHFEHLLLGARVRCTSADPLPEGDIIVGFDLYRRQDRSAACVLRVGALEVGRAELPLTAARPAFWGLDVGRDPVSSVSPRYRERGDFPYPATGLIDVTLDFTDPEFCLDDEATLLEASQ